MYFDFIWTDEIIQHLAEHDVTPEDFADVVCNPYRQDVSATSGRQCAFGYVSNGRYIIAIYEMLDDATVLPVTAYEVPEPSV